MPKRRQSFKSWLTSLTNKLTSWHKRKHQDGQIVLVNQASYEAADRALHKLELLVEQNKLVNQKSQELLARARAISAMMEHY